MSEAIFRWVPGEGCDARAIARLKNNFPKPLMPMGEPWFLSRERKMHAGLSGDPTRVPISEIERALWDITSGFSCFGPRSEWTHWFHYLLAECAERSHEPFDGWMGDSLLERLISAFISLYPNGGDKPPYPEFFQDALNTLGRCMMDQSCWSDGNIVIGQILHRGEGNNGYWGWHKASGDFSASMFFCLKYLQSDRIETWLDSVLAIRCPHWRAQNLAWFVGAHPVLKGEIKQPSQFPESGTLGINWEPSYCLDGSYTGDFSEKPEAEHFLPEANRSNAVSALKSLVTAKVFEDWCLSLQGYPYLVSEIGNLPNQFKLLYLSD